MPKYSANPEGKRTVAIAKAAGVAHGQSIENHRIPYATCHWLGREVLYREGLVATGMEVADAVALVAALEAELESTRLKALEKLAALRDSESRRRRRGGE
jgi:hypothetical protein